MYLVFWITALVGGCFLLLQLATSLLGFGLDIGDSDVDVGSEGADAGGDLGDADGGSGEGHHNTALSLVKYLTVQTAMAFLTFFGLVGLLCLELQLSLPGTIGASMLGGFGSMFLVGYMFQSLRRLEEDGTIQIRRAVGKTARVYLRVPANDQGAGRITVSQQGRTQQWLARTPGPELPTGGTVVITRVIDSKTVEVADAQTAGQGQVPASADSTPIETS